MARIIKAPQSAVAPRKSAKTLRYHELEKVREKSEQHWAEVKKEADLLWERTEKACSDYRRKEEEACAVTVKRQLEEAKAEAKALLTDSREQLARLAVKIAASILSQEITLRESAVDEIILDCLRETGEPRRVVLWVNEKDEARALAVSSAWHQNGRDCALQVCIDGNLERGSCRVETEDGTYERLISEQLAQVSKALTGRTEFSGN